MNLLVVGDFLYCLLLGTVVAVLSNFVWGWYYPPLSNHISALAWMKLFSKNDCTRKVLWSVSSAYSFENKWCGLKCNWSTTAEAKGSFIKHKNCLDVLTLTEQQWFTPAENLSLHVCLFPLFSFSSLLLLYFASLVPPCSFCTQTKTSAPLSSLHSITDSSFTFLTWNTATCWGKSPSRQHISFQSSFSHYSSGSRKRKANSSRW